MVDLNSLTDWVEIAGGVISGGVALYGVYFKWSVLPEKKFKKDTTDNISALQDSFEDYKKSIDQQFKDFDRDINEKIKDFTKTLEDSDKYEQKEIDDFKDDLKGIYDQIRRVEDKNEKLLDLVIRYFSEKND